MRLRYRAGQLRKALWAKPSPEQLNRAAEHLSPQLMGFFSQMQPGEQFHSLEIFEQLVAQGETDPDLLTAALLHDVGKIRYPLRTWERVEIVVCSKLFPNRVTEWGKSAPTGWKRPFVVAQKHPEWGAEMAAQAGANDLTIRLIRRHQEKVQERPGALVQGTPEENLLYRLQRLDDMG